LSSRGAVPIGLGLGRIANFINQELWGAPTLVPWGCCSRAPAARRAIARHPTQLYEALLEGGVMFVLLNWAGAQARPAGTLLAIFLIAYALVRFAIEFLREPDAHIGYLAGDWLTMGQVLSLPMFAIASPWLFAIRKR